MFNCALIRHKNLKNMRKLTLMLAAASIALGASAQLKVVESGQVQVGAVTTSSAAVSDTLATIKIGGPGYACSGGRISFGDGSAYIESPQYARNQFGGKDMLRFATGNGFSFYSGTKRILNYDSSIFVLDGGNPLVSTATVQAPQFLTTSDARAKTDIEPLENIGELLSNIAPVSYSLVDNEGIDSDAGTNRPRKSSARSAKHQYGFLAQDVREVYPDLVYEDSEGMLSIDYTGFIAILVDAVQKLQAESQSQAETIKSQAETIQHLQSLLPGSDKPEEGAVVASLSQNRPNPFRTSTVVSCVLPDDVSSAFLCVYDLNGNQKLRTNIAERGNVDITIEGNTLTAGMYIYTLIADGVEIDSKRMILTD